MSSTDSPPAAASRFETATLGGGCFWCLDAVFRRMEGVEEVVSGYAGGHVANPGYRAVCSGSTGHAEVVQLRFDPSVTSYEELLNVFFTIHDPTTLNRQGADVGTQYRSAIYFHDEGQERVARSVIAELEADGVFEDPVVTEVEPLDVFYPAEGDHQDYYDRNRARPYCRVVIDPKVAKLRERFAHKLAEGV